MSKRKKLIYQNIESLQPIVNVVNDAAVALNDKTRTIKESAIPEVVAGALGAGIGGVGSFMALYKINDELLNAIECANTSFDEYFKDYIIVFE